MIFNHSKVKTHEAIGMTESRFDHIYDLMWSKTEAGFTQSQMIEYVLTTQDLTSDLERITCAMMAGHAMGYHQR